MPHFAVTCPMARTHSFILMNLQFDINPTSKRGLMPSLVEMLFGRIEK